MSAVLFMSGSTMGDALGGIGRSHRPAIEALGYDFMEINLDVDGAAERMNRAIQEQPVAFAFAYAGMAAGLNAVVEGGQTRNFWEALRIPFISLLGDSPAYFFDRHVHASPWQAGLYFFPEHLEFRKRLPAGHGLYGLVPPIPFDLTGKEDIDFSAKVAGKLLFLKNGNDPEQLIRTWRETLPDSLFVTLADLAGDLAAKIGEETELDIDARITAYFLDRGWDLTGVPGLRLFLSAQIDDYLRRVKSTMLAEVLKQFPVEIYGHNWGHVDFSNARATFIPGGDYTKSKEDIRRSLGLIDMSPNTSRGLHERPMRAFGMLTLCLTNEQQFFRENCTDWRQFTFRFDADNIAAKVADVLAQPKRYVDVGVAAAEEFRRTRRPADFVQFMADTADTIRLSNSPRRPEWQPFLVWPPSSI
jgi:hypothetical protein